MKEKLEGIIKSEVKTNKILTELKIVNERIDEEKKYLLLTMDRLNRRLIQLEEFLEDQFEVDFKY